MRRIGAYHEADHAAITEIAGPLPVGSVRLEKGRRLAFVGGGPSTVALPPDDYEFTQRRGQRLVVTSLAGLRAALLATRDDTERALAWTGVSGQGSDLRNAGRMVSYATRHIAEPGERARHGRPTSVPPGPRPRAWCGSGGPR